LKLHHITTLLMLWQLCRSRAVTLKLLPKLLLPQTLLLLPQLLLHQPHLLLNLLPRSNLHQE
jgi:hypothetical protein